MVLPHPDVDEGQPGGARGATRWVLVVALGLVLNACGETPRPLQGGAGEVSLTALPALRPEEDPFGRIADLEVGEDGSVFVLDGLNRTIRVFGPDGSELPSFGRRGQGPGELEQPSRLLWGPAGNLWVLDLGNVRLTVFSPGGELLGTYQPSDLPIFFPLAMAFTGTDTLEWVGMSSPDLMSPAAAWVETHVSRGVVSPVAQVDLPFIEWPPSVEYRGGGMAAVMRVPFSGDAQFGFDDTGRLWYANTVAPRLHRWSTSGDLDLTVDLDVAPVPVTSADREEALASDALEEVRALGQAAIAEMEGSMPENKPYLAGFFFDDEHRIWIAHAAGDAAGSIEREIDIYDVEGSPVGRTRAALALEPRPRVRGGLLAAVVRDELDIESVALYRIDP